MLKYIIVSIKRLDDGGRLMFAKWSKLDDEINKVIQNFCGWEMISFKTKIWEGHKKDCVAHIWLRRKGENE